MEGHSSCTNVILAKMDTAIFAHHDTKKWNIPTRNFVDRDLVLIANKKIPRSNWLLVRITEIPQSKDNMIRVIKLKTKFGAYTNLAANVCLLEESLAEK